MCQRIQERSKRGGMWYTVLTGCRSGCADILRSQLDGVLNIKAHHVIFALANVLGSIVCTIWLLLRCANFLSHLDNVVHPTGFERGPAENTGESLAVLECHSDIFALLEVSFYCPNNLPTHYIAMMQHCMRPGAGVYAR